MSHSLDAIDDTFRSRKKLKRVISYKGESSKSQLGMRFIGLFRMGDFLVLVLMEVFLIYFLFHNII